MHRHHQAKIQDFSGQSGYRKIPVDMALQKWQTLFSASKVNYLNINTRSPIPRHGTLGSTLTATSLDGWHKECRAE
jgi:hypothetical protein